MEIYFWKYNFFKGLLSFFGNEYYVELEFYTKYF